MSAISQGGQTKKPRIRHAIDVYEVSPPPMKESVETDEPEVFPPDSQPNLFRLRMVLWMVAQGRSQKEIAAYFQCCERTVRRWITQAKNQGLVLSSDLVPDDVVAEIVQHFLERKADLLDLKREAEASGNFAARVLCIRELLRAEVAYVASLDKIGFFDGYRYVPKGRTDPEVQGAERLNRAAEAILPRPSQGDSRE